MLENLDAMDELDLPIEVVQLDDGYQTEIGDWLSLSSRFDSLPDLVDRIRQRGRGTGIWTAPFLVGERSQVAAHHPGLAGRRAGRTAARGTQLGAGPLRARRHAPGRRGVAAGGLPHVRRAGGSDCTRSTSSMRARSRGSATRTSPGSPRTAAAWQLIREAIGPDSYLLGCGAPILPSVGLVDGLRVGPDTAPEHEPLLGDMSQPSSKAAMLTSAARAFTHGRFWAADPDCLIVRPEVQEREAWAAHVERYGGVRASSDRLRSLDDWGLETTRRLLTERPPRVLVES